MVGPGVRLSGVFVLVFAVDRDAFARAQLELVDVLERLAARGRVVDDELLLHGWFALLPDDRAAIATRLQGDAALVSLKRPAPSPVSAPSRYFALLVNVAEADRLRLIAYADALNAEAARMSDADAVWLEHAALVAEETRRELVEAFERHSVPIPRPREVRPAHGGRLAGRTVLVDASNLAWRAIDREVSPTAALDATVRALREAGADPARLDVIFDASFFGNKRGAARRMPRSEWALLERGEAEGRWRRTPASTKTDEQILGRLCADPGAIVVSNDLFHKERDEGLTPPDLFDRHIKVDLGPRDLRLSFPKSWPDAPNVVVRYASSRATR